MMIQKNQKNRRLQILNASASLLALSTCLISATVTGQETAAPAPDNAAAKPELKGGPIHKAPRHTPFTRGGLHEGVFSGGFDPVNAAKYEDWLGKKSAFNVEFLTETAFTDYVTPDGKKVTDSLDHMGWVLDVWTKAHRQDRNMMFSIPLATKQDRSLAHVADGQYDHTYAAVARAIAKSYPDAIIRIGWEFNADWYSWSAKGRPDDYIKAFRHVAALFKTASPDFTVDWCPDHGFSANMAAETAYPGDDVVDVIGMDMYNDYRWGNYKDDPEKRWNWLQTYSHGLDWQAKFAFDHGKPMSIPEWGVDKDDPVFIRHMHQWLNTHDYAYEAYWNSNSAFRGTLSNDQYPEAAAEFKQRFGSDTAGENKD